MGPNNYTVDVANPFAAAVQGFGVGQQLGQAINQAEARPAMEEAQMQAREALVSFANKAQPTAQDYQRVLLFNPGLKDILGEGWKAMSAERRKADFGFGAQVLAATAGGNTDVAEQLLTERATAARNSGDEEQAKVFGDYAKLVQINPQAAERGIGLLLASIDPDGFDKAYKAISEARIAEAKLPGEIAEQKGKAAKALTEGAMAGDVISADIAYKQAQRARLEAMTAEAADRLALDRDTLGFEMDKYLDKTAADVDAGAGAANLSVGMEKVVDDATMAAVTASARSQKAKTLARKFQALEGGGVDTRLIEAAKEAFSGERDLIRTEAAGLLNQEVVSMLPPGPATDRDITIMREGVPSAYSSPEKITAFLGAMARTADRAARAQAARASWVSQNGNAGVLRRDIVVEGREVPKGTSFVEFMKIVGEADARAGR
jgi:SOS response regulatory protein OraA/RecX